MRDGNEYTARNIFEASFLYLNGAPHLEQTIAAIMKRFKVPAEAMNRKPVSDAVKAIAAGEEFLAALLKRKQ